jgi:hypothetical protein
VIVLAVVVVGVVVWTISDRHGTRTADAPSATTVPTTAPVPTDPPPAPSTTVAPPTSNPAPTTTTVSPPAPAGTVPPPVVGTDSITYTLPAGTPVLVTAVNPCWIQVRPSASGPVSQEEILPAGQQLSLPSPVWIRFGDPSSARATVGSTPLRLPRLSGQLVVVSPAP